MVIREAEVGERRLEVGARRSEARSQRPEVGGQKSEAENHFCAERSDATGFFAVPEFDTRRMARVRCRSASSIFNFSAMGRSASCLRRARLPSTIRRRLVFILI